jgi:hypothetical protein
MKDSNKKRKPKAKVTKKDKPKTIEDIIEEEIIESNQDNSKALQIVKKAADKKGQAPLIIAETDPLGAEAQAAIEYALKHYVTPEVMRDRKIMMKDLGVLETVVTEYLKNFILIGYDLAGEKMMITHATNSQEYDSLIEHARGSLLSLIMKSQQNLPGFGG